MFTRAVKVISLIAFCVLCAAFLASCASTEGRTLEKVVAAENRAKKAEEPSQKPSENEGESEKDKKGLKIESDPSQAEVWIDGKYLGITPLLVESLPQGRHEVVLRKTGYYSGGTWIDFSSDYLLYKTDLKQITGFLQLSVTPANGSITVAGDGASPGMIELPVGNSSVRVRAFGYKDYNSTVTIMEKSVTSLDVVLETAPFELTGLWVPKTSVNPDNPGALGFLDGGFSVTGPGSGEVTIQDKSSLVLFSRKLPEFETWNQGFTLQLGQTSGKALPDGEYTLAVSAKGSGSDATSRKEVAIHIDRTLKVAVRSVWSGGSGLLYAPVAEVLPQGDFQVSMLGAVFAADSIFRAPATLGVRAGLGGGVELDAVGGVIIGADNAPFMASFGARWNLLTPKDSFGPGSAVETRISMQYNPNARSVLLTDTFANFTGLSVGVPVQLSLGSVSFLGSVGATVSLWYPYRMHSDFSPEQGLVTWLYLRGGVMIDTGGLTAGISASTRTQPLPGGVTLLGWPIPFQVGAEAHWLIPDTRILLSGIVAGEYENGDNYYFMGGGGIGFIY
jgi:hypothetical protein